MTGPTDDEADKAWANLLGPAYEARQVARLLMASETTVATMPGLVRLSRRDATEVYPAFQFGPAGVLPGVPQVVAALTPVADSHWTLAAWFVVPADGLNGATPIETIETGRPADVIALARSLANSTAAHAWIGPRHRSTVNGGDRSSR